MSAEVKQQTSVGALRERLGEYAKDIKLNLGTVLTVEGAPDLTVNQIHGVALASAYATRNTDVVAAIEGETASTLSDAERNAAKAAATIMAMNNIYYRFAHLANDEEISTMPARLRMNVIGNPGIPKAEFELYCLAVSAINGCGRCMEAHLREVVKGDISKTGVHSAVRVASVVSAAAQAVEIG